MEFARRRSSTIFCPPPGATPELVVSELNAGQPFRMTWGGLPAGTAVTVALSTTGPGVGPCPPVLGGTCLGITSPRIIGRGALRAGRYAVLGGTLPTPFVSRVYDLQAVAVAPSGQGLLSNAFQRGTGPSICPLIFDPVCGYDRTTYDNACVAVVMGMSIKDWGFCP